ncbi:MAG: J domain-containing protein [Alphaproteobacteria bacterium]
MLTEKPSASVCYYDVLQVSPRSSDEDVKRAYRRLAMVYHPDLNPQNRNVAELRFRLINEAYAHLKTRERRMRYNHNKRAKIVEPGKNDNAPPAPSWFSHLASVFLGSERQNSGSKA